MFLFLCLNNIEILQLYFQRWTELNKKWMPKEIIIMPYQVAIITVGDPKGCCCHCSVSVTTSTLHFSHNLDIKQFDIV